MFALLTFCTGYPPVTFGSHAPRTSSAELLWFLRMSIRVAGAIGRLKAHALYNRSELIKVGLHRPMITYLVPRQNGQYFKNNIHFSHDSGIFRFYYDLIKMFLCYNWKYLVFGSGIGFAWNRWQSFTWANDDSIHRCIYVSPNPSV